MYFFTYQRVSRNGPRCNAGVLAGWLAGVPPAPRGGTPRGQPPGRRRYRSVMTPSGAPSSAGVAYFCFRAITFLTYERVSRNGGTPL